MRPTTANLRWKARVGIGRLAGGGLECSRRDNAHELTGGFWLSASPIAGCGASVQSAFITVTRPFPTIDLLIAVDAAQSPDNANTKTERNLSAHSADYEFHEKIEGD